MASQYITQPFLRIKLISKVPEHMQLQLLAMHANRKKEGALCTLKHPEHTTYGSAIGVQLPHTCVAIN